MQQFEGNDIGTSTYGALWGQVYPSAGQAWVISQYTAPEGCIKKMLGFTGLLLESALNDKGVRVAKVAASAL